MKTQNRTLYHIGVMCSNLGGDTSPYYIRLSTSTLFHHLQNPDPQSQSNESNHHFVKHRPTTQVKVTIPSLILSIIAFNFCISLISSNVPSHHPVAQIVTLLSRCRSQMTFQGIFFQNFRSNFHSHVSGVFFESFRDIFCLDTHTLCDAYFWERKAFIS